MGIAKKKGTKMNTQEAIEILDLFEEYTSGKVIWKGRSALDFNNAVNHAVEYIKKYSWHPIETAPMCEDIDVWTQYGRKVRCQHDDYGHWFIWSAEFNQYVSLSPSIKPTHWMPLHKSPEESDA